MMIKRLWCWLFHNKYHMLMYAMCGPYYTRCRKCGRKFNYLVKL